MLTFIKNADFLKYENRHVCFLLVESKEQLGYCCSSSDSHSNFTCDYVFLYVANVVKLTYH
jgi:hypothetical protein